MAVDPEHPEDIFVNSNKRGGRFPNYHGLRLYYVGYGGNMNKTTRFRRYSGTGERPLLPEHDLGHSSVLLQPNARMRIQLVVSGDRVQYIRNGEVIYDVKEIQPCIGREQYASKERYKTYQECYLMLDPPALTIIECCCYRLDKRESAVDTERQQCQEEQCAEEPCPGHKG